MYLVCQIIGLSVWLLFQFLQLYLSNLPTEGCKNCSKCNSNERYLSGCNCIGPILLVLEHAMIKSGSND